MRYISINGQTIRSNAKHGRNNAPIRVAKSPSDSRPQYAHEVNLVGPGKLLYDPEKAIMRCGARLVLVVEDVEIVR